MTEQQIRNVVKETVKELKRVNLLRDNDEFQYIEGAKVLKDYFSKSPDNVQIKTALEALKKDIYIDVIYMYYRDGLTMEQIAEAFNVEVSTIYRNKKRLVISICNMVM